MTEHEAIVLAGWRRLEAASREAGNVELADQAKHFGDLLEQKAAPIAATSTEPSSP